MVAGCIDVAADINRDCRCRVEGGCDWEEGGGGCEGILAEICQLAFVMCKM